MEETKTQNIQDSVKYYCRVCTTNTRSKKSKPGDGIGIFKKEGLKSILERYLQLHISENDQLPKVICKVCLEKIEAVEFLRVMARRTESLLKDFLTNQSAQNQFQNEYNTFAISLSTKPDEVVVNVSLSDPLTKDINKKLLVAQRRKDSLDKAFSPSQIGASAVTSSPNIAPLTIVHQMPRKKIPSAVNLIEKRKNLQMALSNATTVTLEPPPPATTAIKHPARTKMSTAPPPPPLRHISEAPAIPQKVEIHPVITEHTAAVGHAITLGSIIKDEDLLRLILKALKWPFNNQTIDIQIQRLKDTNFGDIIVDPNLLQDADLIQILGPLIHPTMTALPTTSQQQTYIAIPPEQGVLPPATISYKLPAETSVQIITVPPEEKTTPPKAQPKPSTANVRKVMPMKKRRPAQKIVNTGVIVVSDESEDDSVMEIRDTDNVQRFEVQLDPAMYQDASENSNSNEAMLATLNRQRAALMRLHRSKRKQSLLGANIEMVDDIMIVDEGVHMKEPYPDVVLVKKRRRTPPPVIMPTASTSSFKPMSSSTQVIQPAKKISVPSPMLPKATSTPLRKPTATPPSIRNVSQTEMPGLTKLPPKKDIHRIAIPQTQPTTSLQSLKSTTLADADSTTKIIIKESKLPKEQKAFADIEEQITKVRIGKQVHRPAQGEGNTKTYTPDEDGEVVIVVEYEADNEGRAKEPVEEVHKVEGVIVVPQIAEKESAAEHIESEKPSEELAKKSDNSDLSSIKIKEELQEVTETKEAEEPLKEDKEPESEEKKEDAERSKTPESDDVSKTTIKAETPRYTRSKLSQKKQTKKPQQQTATTTFRPARKSKTLSKYYKGPPATSETAGRSMRSRS